MRDPMSPYWSAVKERMSGKAIESKRGDPSNPRIVWYHWFTPLMAKSDQVPWCASFVSAMAAINQYTEMTSAAARDWSTYGEIGSGSVGDIVVLTRDGGHHVGFVDSQVRPGDSVVWVLGGNQNNCVCVQSYPIDRVVAFRRFPY